MRAASIRNAVSALGIEKAVGGVQGIWLFGFVVGTFRTIPIPPIASNGKIQATLIMKTKSISFTGFVNGIG